MRDAVRACLVWLVLAVSVRANIGETQAEIEARLGRPAATVEDQAGYRTCYEKNGFRILVIWKNGKSVFEMVSLLSGQKIPNETRAMLFVAYGAGQEWNQVGEAKEWDRADGKIVAMLDEQTGQMVFSEADYFHALEREQSSAKARSFTDVFGPIPSPSASPSNP